MLRFLVERPIAVLMSFLGFLILGLVVLNILPVSLLPEVPIPEITVQISYPNTSARELENTVVRRLRQQLLQVGRLKDIKSRTRNAAASILLEFEFGTNTNLAFIEVNEKIDQVMGNLPKDLARPSVLKANATDIPVFYLSVVRASGFGVPGSNLGVNGEAQQSLELSEFTRSVLKRRIEQLPQVAFVDRSGFAEPEIFIRPKPAVLQSLKLSEKDLENILDANNLDLGSILVQDGQYQYNLRFLSRLTTKEEVENSYFNHHGRVFQLKDVADVELRTQQRRGFYLYNGKEAIVFSIRKQATAQLFALRREFKKLLDGFEKDYPQLDFYLSNDQSELLEVSVGNLRTSLLYGSIFAFLILFFFFREWKAPLLIGVAIPVALIIALFGFYLLKISINVISLSGLILGVGLMIDNSIIVMDNVRQYRQMGFGKTDSCVKGANEVIRPLISSTLTTCSVFVPLIFLSGIGGALFYDQAISITLALSASLVVAYLLLPTLLNLGSPDSKRENQTEEPIIAESWTDRFYKKSVAVVLKNKILFLLLFVCLTALAILPFRALPQESFPNLSRKGISLKIDWNEAISLDENKKRVLEILTSFRNKTESSNSFVGEQQFLLTQEEQSTNEATLILYPTDIQNFTLFKSEIESFFYKNHPAASLEIRPLKNIFDEVFGGDKPLLIAHLQSAKSRETPEVETVQPVFEFLHKKGIPVNSPPMQEQFFVRILRAKALLYKVPYSNIYRKLQTVFNQNIVSTLKTTNQYIPVAIGTDAQTLYQSIQQVKVANSENASLPLRTFVELTRGRNFKTLVAGKTGESFDLPIDAFSDSLMKELKKVVAKSGALMVTFSGQVFENARSLRELAAILSIAILLLYLILAAQFESLIQPFIVILTVPVGLSGALFALWLFSQSLNLISIIGIIVMSGIVVNDAILKVDMMNRLSQKLPLKKAIHEAGRRRLKPIVMTSLTTILALLPVLFSFGMGAELQRPLAIAVIGGLTIGTVASLYFIPSLYFILKSSISKK